jgi:hypothetical protein
VCSEKFWETFSKFFNVNFTEIYAKKKLQDIFSEIFYVPWRKRKMGGEPTNHIAVNIK